MLIRRTVTTAAATTAALALLSGTALAHDCFIGTGSTKGNASDNFHVITAEDGAAMMHGYVVACPEASTAGYAALKSAGLPASIKIFVGGPKNAEHFVLGGKSGPIGDGKGLEVFGASTLAFDMVDGFVSGASAHAC